MLRFDHAYTSDREHRFFRRLISAGFMLHPHVTHHPGPHENRFIFLPGASKANPFCLEFIHHGLREKVIPGFSLAASGPLRRYFESVRENRFLKARYWHRNYEWKTKGNKKGLPGWNFVEYGTAFPAANVWLTEFERGPGVKGRRTPIAAKFLKHANTVTGIHGFEFDVAPADRRFFEEVLGRRIGRSTRLECGTRLYLNPAARTRFRNAILEAADLKEFERWAHPDGWTRFFGRKAAVVRNPSRFWDILVIGRESGR